MRHKINIRGVIVPESLRDVYELFGEFTTPVDVNRVLMQMTDGDGADVYINSGGGEISSGSEIYTALREAAQTHDIMIHITGAAHSAASVIAMAAKSEMAPTALMMVHCVSSWAVGNHADLEHEAEMLRTADRALCTAYTAKTGMTEEQALEMMEHETWLTAQEAVERGLVDGIMFEDAQAPGMMAAAASGAGLLSAEQIERIRAMMGKKIEPTEELTGYSAAEIAHAQRLQIGRIAMQRKE